MTTHGTVAASEVWPELPYAASKDTLETLHRKIQIVGKVRLSLSPSEPQWANVPLYLTARGLTTTPMEFSGRVFQRQHSPESIRPYRLISGVGGVLGKGPVHFFWGSFDLANTRFSGRLTSS